MPITTQPRTDITSASRPGRHRRLRAYAVGAGAVAVLGVCALAVAGQAMTQQDQTFAADGVRELVIDQDSGNVSLVAGSTAGQHNEE